MTLTTALAVVLSVMPWYTQTLDVNFDVGEVTYIEIALPKPRFEKNLLKNQPEYEKFISFTQSNKTGWRSDINSYASGRTFSAKTFKINCLDNFVVLNYQREQVGWVQVSKPIVPGSCPLVGASQ